MAAINVVAATAPVTAAAQAVTGQPNAAQRLADLAGRYYDEQAWPKAACR